MRFNTDWCQNEWKWGEGLFSNMSFNTDRY